MRFDKSGSSFALINEAFLAAQRPSSVCSLPVSARIELVRADRPRRMIADHVGVGKTIGSGFDYQRTKVTNGCLEVGCETPLD